MFDTQKKLEVSQEQLEVIEAALHTQYKILNVQAEAGGQGALERLNEIKSLLTQLALDRKRDTPAPQKNDLGWFSFRRCMP